MQHARLTLEGILKCAMYPPHTPEILTGSEVAAMAEEVNGFRFDRMESPRCLAVLWAGYPAAR